MSYLSFELRCSFAEFRSWGVKYLFKKQKANNVFLSPIFFSL